MFWFGNNEINRSFRSEITIWGSKVDAKVPKPNRKFVFHHLYFALFQHQMPTLRKMPPVACAANI